MTTHQKIIIGISPVLMGEAVFFTQVLAGEAGEPGPRFVHLALFFLLALGISMPVSVFDFHDGFNSQVCVNCNRF